MRYETAREILAEAISNYIKQDKKRIRAAGKTAIDPFIEQDKKRILAAGGTPEQAHFGAHGVPIIGGKMNKTHLRLAKQGRDLLNSANALASAKRRSGVREAIEQIDEGRKTYAQRSASLIGRMGGSPEEVRQGITGKRNPAAKSGRALLTKAHKAAEKKREKDPYYPYGKAESRRMSKYMREASELDESNPAPYGYKMVGGKMGKRGRVIGGRWKPLTHDEWRAANPPRDWKEVNRRSAEHAREQNPDRDHRMTGPDDHLPGGVGAAAKAERLAAIKKHRASRRYMAASQRYMAEAKPPEDMTPYHPDNTDPRVSPSSKPYHGRPDRGPKPMPIPRPGSGIKPSWVRPLGPTDPDWHYGLPNYPFPPDLSGSGGRPNSVANRTRTTK